MRVVAGTFLFLLQSLLATSLMQADVQLPKVPAEIASKRFAITVNGQPTDFAHAAENYYFVNFDITKKTRISITAPSDDYWAKGVEVQPWRENIRPSVQGRTITFSLTHPAKLSVTRPGDYLGGAEMLFVFANAPEIDPPTAGSSSLRYYGPGVYHESIDAKSGDNIYIAPGAVIFGSINLWGVDNVKIFGRGVIVYDGPQNPADDDGWIHRLNWHVIVMDNAHHIDISGITCVTRSRTWMIQMKNSRFIQFDNVKEIGGSPGNANQDGMDWLGGGDTLVKDSFIRAADDVFALEGNWDGYSAEAMATPGQDVTNIRIENSVVSTSISNIVRVNWPHKTFNSSNFVMHDSDVIHMGIGGCVVPFALFQLWADPDGHGEHKDYLFDNIRLEDWYSFVQILQPNPSVRDISFKDIWALESLPRVPSVFKGDVDGVQFENVKVAGRVVSTDYDLPLQVLPEAAPPAYSADPQGVHASFGYSPLAPAPRRRIRFEAAKSQTASGKAAKYEWFFGDGTSATGRVVRHAMPDAEGTLQDGSGRFRVLLKVTDQDGHVDWASNPVVVRKSLDAPLSPPNPVGGLDYRYYEGAWESLPDFSTLNPVATGSAAGLTTDAHAHTYDYAFLFDGFVRVPTDGGYTFSVVSRDGGLIEVDDKVVATSPAPWPQVCGSIGNAAQLASGTVGLKAGLHRLRVAVTQKTGEDVFSVQWQGPGIPLSQIPSQMLFHSAQGTSAP